jgi:serine/threonine protein kinase
MRFTKQPGTEPIPGYRLIAPIGCGGFGEVWKCQVPGGLCKAIKFVYGNLDSIEGHSTQAHEELHAVQHIKDLRHPFLLSMDRVESVRGELMIVTELADKNLHEVLKDWQAEGRAGIPRDELLRYLAEVAEVLDLMNLQHGLQHLDIKPQNLFLVSNHIKVGDFGLVTSLSGGAGIKLGSVTPLYAAPEVFQGKVSRGSDQYSLACCFVELLTGRLPFQGCTSRQLLMQHLNDEPDLSLLPDSDRPAVAQALEKDPLKRHASCSDFLRALSGAASGRVEASSAPRANDTVPLGDLGKSASGTQARSQALTQTPSVNKSSDNDADRLGKNLPILPPALSGYQLVEKQSSSLLADIWKAIAPDGRLRQIKFIYGFTGRCEEAIQRLQALQHPALPKLEVVQSGPGWLVLVNDYGKESLHDRWQKCQSLKLPGIPRLELLSYLRTVAEALDYLYQQHSLHHLALNPRVLVLADAGLQVADFGLAQLFWVPDGQPVAQRNQRYAAPELFHRQVHRASDQYSLAIIYTEMLTGSHPYADWVPRKAERHATTSKRKRDRRSGRNKLKPYLEDLPERDREAIKRALEPDPLRRWPSCLDLIRALEESDDDRSSPCQTSRDVLKEVVVTESQPPLPKPCGTAEELQQILRDLIAFAGGTVPAEEQFGMARLSETGDELLQRFRVGLPIGSTRLRVDAFRQQCEGDLLGEDEQSYEFHVLAPTNFWQSWMGRQPGLELRVELTRPHALSATPIEVAVTVRAVRCGKNKAMHLLQGFGANLLESLRAFLLVNSEKRTHDRLLWPHPVEVCAIEEDGSIGPTVMCRGKDISLGGIAFYLPQPLPTSQVLVRLPATPNSQPITILATLVRAQRCADGWYDVGALFRLAAFRSSNPEIFTPSTSVRAGNASGGSD